MFVKQATGLKAHAALPGHGNAMAMNRSLNNKHLP